MKYIDTHCHIFPHSIAAKVVENLQNYYGFLWEGTGEADDLLQSISASKIDKSVIFSCATKPDQVTSINDYIASLVQENPDLFIGLGTLHPDYEDCRNEIRRIRELGLKGVKFHADFQRFAIDDPKMMALYEEIGDSLVMLLHTGDENSDLSAPRRLAHVLDQFPHLKVIAAHLGGYAVWDEAKKYLLGRNLYWDISSTTVTGKIDLQSAKELIRAHGVDKVLFATDYPVVHHRRMIDEVLQMGFTQEENEAIFYRNAAKLFGIIL